MLLLQARKLSASQLFILSSFFFLSCGVVDLHSAVCMVTVVRVYGAVHGSSLRDEPQQPLNPRGDAQSIYECRVESSREILARSPQIPRSAAKRYIPSSLSQPTGGGCSISIAQKRFTISGEVFHRRSARAERNEPSEQGKYDHRCRLSATSSRHFSRGCERHKGTAGATRRDATER